jgi:hypothetical protein
MTEKEEIASMRSVQFAVFQSFETQSIFGWQRIGVEHLISWERCFGAVPKGWNRITGIRNPPNA